MTCLRPVFHSLWQCNYEIAGLISVRPPTTVSPPPLRQSATYHSEHLPQSAPYDSQPHTTVITIWQSAPYDSQRLRQSAPYHSQFQFERTAQKQQNKIESLRSERTHTSPVTAGYRLCGGFLHLVAGNCPVFFFFFKLPVLKDVAVTPSFWLF